MAALEMSFAPKTGGLFTYLMSIFHSLSKRKLDRALEDAGVKILPRDLVREHMQNEIAKYRPRWLSWERSLLLFSRKAAKIFFLPTLFFVAVIFALDIGNGFVFLTTVPLAIFAIIYVVVTVHLAFMMVRMYDDSPESKEQINQTLDSEWKFLKLPPGETLDIPHHIAERTKTAMRVPRVKVKRAEFDEDPIVFAYQRNWLGIIVCAPIGAYETNTALDNM